QAGSGKPQGLPELAPLAPDAFGFPALVAAVGDRLRQEIVRQLDAVGPEVMLVPQEVAVDERRELAFGDRAFRDRALDRIAVAEAVLGDQLFFDEAPHALGLIGHAAAVEVGDDRSLAALDELFVECRLAVSLAVLVHAAAEQAEERRLDGIS